jgi:excisionase family DNA binding protein
MPAAPLPSDSAPALSTLMTLAEVAAYLRLTVESVRQMLRQGKFVQPIRLGPRTKILFDKEEVKAFLRARRQGGAA